jgi:hypothetical protein
MSATDGAAAAPLAPKAGLRAKSSTTPTARATNAPSDESFGDDEAISALEKIAMKMLPLLFGPQFDASLMPFLLLLPGAFGFRSQEGACSR